MPTCFLNSCTIAFFYLQSVTKHDEIVLSFLTSERETRSCNEPETHFQPQANPFPATTLPLSLGKSPSGKCGEILFSLCLASPAVSPLSVHLWPFHPFPEHSNTVSQYHICCNQGFLPPTQPSFIWVHFTAPFPPTVCLFLILLRSQLPSPLPSSCLPHNCLSADHQQAEYWSG